MDGWNTVQLCKMKIMQRVQKAVDKLVSNEENASPDTPDKFKIDLKSNANSDST